MNIPARRVGPRAAKVTVAVILLVALYTMADWRAVARAVAGLDPGYLVPALILFVPQTLVSAARWRFLAAPVCRISLLEGTRQTLAASALNLVIPSKLGDLTKALMLPVEPADRVKAGRWVVFEKISDVAALSAFVVVGSIAVDCRILTGVAALLLALFWLTGRSTLRLPRDSILTRATICAAWSIVLWSLHLLQIHWFLLAAGVETSLAVTAARVPLAIFAGLLPVSFCGLGTRDAALVWLFSDTAPAATMAAVGALTALRYLVPGLAGIALLPRYLPKGRRLAWQPAGRRSSLAR